MNEAERMQKQLNSSKNAVSIVVPNTSVREAVEVELDGIDAIDRLLEEGAEIQIKEDKIIIRNIPSHVQLVVK